MIDKVLYLVYVSIALLSIFHDYGGINTNGRGVGGLTLLSSLRIISLFPKLIQGLARLT